MQVITDEALIPSASNVSSPSSQSTHYTDYFGENDISMVIAQLSDDDDDTTPKDTPMPEIPTVGIKRKRSQDDEEWPRKFTKRVNSSESDSSATVVETFSNASASTSQSPAEDFVAPKPVLVAYGPHMSPYLSPLPWGVQWEIARYAMTPNFGYDKFEITELKNLQSLGTNSSAAPKVTEYVESQYNRKDKDIKSNMLDEFADAYSFEQSATLPWEELDREERILSQYSYGGLGCNEDDAYNESDPYWYGGKVHFTARVMLSKNPKSREPFQFILERPTLGSSNRIMRRFGSRRFVRARIQKEVLNMKGNQLVEYFQRPFVIGGVVFRAFFAKEQSVFLVRTNEVATGPETDVNISDTSPGTDMEMSFMDFIEWHNPLSLNIDQTMAKWAARFALPLSNSVPGLRLRPDRIKFQDDIVCDAFDGRGKPPSQMQMTDGCGFANRAVMKALKDRFAAWQDEPTAIQCRVGGAKGLLLVLHDISPVKDMETKEKNIKPEENMELMDDMEPTVWLRPSQIKIKYSSLPPQECILPTGTDLAKTTIDVLRTSRMKSPAHLSTETIINFAENGVPYDYFCEAFKIDLQQRVDALMKWVPENNAPKPNPFAMQLLWDAVAREGGVTAARLTRADPGRARVSGYVAEDHEDELEDEDGLSQLDAALHQQSSAWWEDTISGSPSSLPETCLTLLASGFTPDKCPVLAVKLAEVAKKVVKAYNTKYRLAVPMSCSAFIVPDPYGVLKANEIHVRSSKRDLLDPQNRLTDIVLGDVLVTRHPCKVPSDVQKVKAVFNKQLLHYCDVIVISTKNHLYQGKPLNRHLASLTGGGDYDGDTMEVYWDPVAVNAFKVPDPRVFAVESPMMEGCLQKNTISVSEYLSNIPTTASNMFKTYSLQKHLLGALRDKALVGQYSTWWENSLYAKGYSHPDTIFLANMFCAVLDGSKTGVTVVPAKYQEHCRNKDWQARPPAWKESEDDRRRAEESVTTRPQVQRPDLLSPFIMDRLRERVDACCREQFRLIEKRLPPDIIAKRDDHLAGPWEDACARAEKLGCTRRKEELKLIKEHVEAMYIKNKEIHRAGAKNQKTGNSPFTELPIEKRQDALRKLSYEFHTKPANILAWDAVTKIKASYAYIYDFEMSSQHWSRFPWNVATRALCDIKAHALGYPKTIAREFYEGMVISSSYVRKYSNLG